MVAAQISDCLAKTEMLVVLANQTLHNSSIQLGSSSISPSRTARNLRVGIDYHHTILLEQPSPADLPYTTLGRFGTSDLSILHNVLPFFTPFFISLHRLPIASRITYNL